MKKIYIYKLLKILRSNHTQKEMGLKLNKSAYIYHKWEAGYKDISAREFNEVCILLNINFPKILTSILGINSIGNFQNDTIQSILLSWKPGNIQDFLEATQYSKSKWSRLKNHQKDISLFDLFNTIHFLTKRMSIILSELGHIKNPLIKENINHYKLSILLDLYRKFPAISSITATIYLKEVKETRGLKNKIQSISNFLHQDYSDVSKIIFQLLNEEILFINKDDNLDFHVFENNLDFYSIQSGMAIYRYIQHHIQRSLEIKPSGRSLNWNYRVAPVSLKAEDEIRGLSREFSDKVYQVLKKDLPNEKQKVIGVTSAVINFPDLDY